MEHKPSVVIATHNRRATLERTVAALTRQTTRDFQIVVVDDGSTDDTWEWLQARAADSQPPTLTIERQSNRGQGQARNLGLRHVANGLVLFLGDDVIPRRSFVAEHIVAHERAEGPCAVIGFTDWCRSDMKVTPALEMANREGHQFGFGHMIAGGEVPFTCFYTSNLSVPRGALWEDPFDAAFTAYGWEDVELGYRLSRSGLRIFYHPAAAAEHLHPMNLTYLFQRQRMVGRGIHTLLGLHPELDGDPRLAPQQPPWWFSFGRRLVPLALPLLNVIDGRGLPLSTRLLHRVLMCGYYIGQHERARARG